MNKESAEYILKDLQPHMYSDMQMYEFLSEYEYWTIMCPPINLKVKTNNITQVKDYMVALYNDYRDCTYLCGIKRSNLFRIREIRHDIRDKFNRIL